MNPFIPFFLGFIIATILSVVIMMITEEVRKKRAIAFTKRFSLISEGLSSLKALAFRVTGQLKKIRPQCQPQNITKENIEQISSYIDSMIYIFDIISAGMMPPTEEIAMGAITGKKNSAEQKAYEDSIKFRDDIRRIRHQLDEVGLDGLKQFLTPEKEKKSFEVKIV
ncbi:MAG: hypothetical protein KBC30_04000 [Planctomycetes bacterium]|jgi:hypothetical protein|nr:hypothetical protein [Planctomycetota bacterium]HON45677.1 hypothetical protein [Planctomycetota bacterium]HPY74451.1 hypothetical protein [Planctomycetota bacterium]HQB00003.1 hypothetical protein [Planctomycetota bacterium]HRU50931.1 hypothetical protein [Planctomycetota bacterium]